MEFGGKNYIDVELNGWLYDKGCKRRVSTVKSEKNTLIKKLGG